jgi:hypothetical protein
VAGLVAQIRASQPDSTMPGTMPPALPSGAPVAAVAALEATFDARNGGWGRAPKFPQPMTLEFLLRRLSQPGADADGSAGRMLRRTLDAMAAGGLRDQLGGGFHRYSTDGQWLAPHFEQMLYDNAQLARAYLHAWQLLGEASDLAVARATLDAIIRDFSTSGGGLAASRDADTDGVEGATFTWTPAEVAVALPAEGQDLGLALPLALAAWDVSDGGNWHEGHGRTILRRIAGDAELAETFGLPAADVHTSLERSRAALLEARDRRPQPNRDDKVLAGWNGLAIGALAEAAVAFEADGDDEAGEHYRHAAIAAAADCVDHLLTADGRLGRSWKDGRVTGTGVLEDYACVADGLLALYGATFDERWFVVARGLADTILERFADPTGGFFDTRDDHEVLITRPKDLLDNAVPSGNAMATTVLLRLAAMTGQARYREAAERAIGLVAEVAPRHPTFFGQWLVALDFGLADVDEVAIIGEPASPPTRALLSIVERGFRPHQVVAARPGSASTAIELLEDRSELDGRSTAFVCHGFVCRLPVTEPAALAELLEPTTGARP